LTYLETVNDEGIPSADILQYHIKDKIENTGVIHKNFVELTNKQLKGLKVKKVRGCCGFQRKLKERIYL